jgi:NAD(P)-dependent dehydrogenase (short-subunit alcohol dehydrogenase family)
LSDTSCARLTPFCRRDLSLFAPQPFAAPAIHSESGSPADSITKMAFDTTTDDVIKGVRLDGKTVLVTGASTGLGLETARALAMTGANVVLTARSEDKGTSAEAAIRESVADARLEHGILELGSLASVRSFADWFLAGHDRLDVLINNAGVMFTPFDRTTDGFELQFGTNHLGPFLLTARLIPALRAAAPSRVVNLSSVAHSFSDIDWDDPNYRSRPYDKFQAYGQSKTAAILFTRELERRLGPAGIHSYAVHPGNIPTQLLRHMGPDDFTAIRKLTGATGPPPPGSLKTVQTGAATSVWAAVAPELADRGGAYLSDCEICDDDQAYTRDPAAAARLWSLSEELVGERFA